MKSKFKIGLSALIPIATVGAVAPLTTACSKTSKVINHVHQSASDVKYGLNANTYSLLKKDYETKYKAALDDAGITEGSPLRQSRMNDLHTAFNVFDNKAASTSISYSALTSSLIGYARSRDGIQLRRVTNTKWSDINALFQGAYDSFDLYMTHEHFSEERKAQILNDATLKFNAKIAKLEEQGYKQNDPYGALQEVRTELITYFDAINDRIGVVAAQQNLATFLKKYKINYLKAKAPVSDIRSDLTACVGKVMSDELFNKVFTIVDLETGQSTKFTSNLMIPGYTIIPTLASFNENPKSNEYSINVKYSAIKTSILNSNDEIRKQRLTARVYDFSNEVKTTDVMFNKDDMSDDELFAELENWDQRTYDYSLYNENDDEKQKIKEIYFNDSNPENKYIRFAWPKAGEEGYEECCIDPIFNKIDYENKDKPGYLNLEELADTGLRISQDGKKWYSLKEGICSSNNKAYHNMSPDDVPLEDTLIDEFLRNCNVTAKVIFNGTSAQSYTISSTFGVSFVETQSEKKTFEDLYIVEDRFVFNQIENYPVSQLTFKNLCDKFTALNNEINEFDKQQSKVSKMITEINWWITGMMGIEIFASVCLTVLGAKIYSGGLSATSVFGMIAGFTAIADAIWCQVILGKILHPVQKYYDGVLEVQRLDVTANLKDARSRDINNFVIIDEQGNYNKQEFEQKYNKFTETTIDNQWKTISYYNTLFNEGHPGHEFLNALEQHEITAKKFNEIAALMSNSNEDYTKLKTLTILEIPLNIITLCDAIFEKSEEEQAQQPEQPEQPQPQPQPEQPQEIDSAIQNQPDAQQAVEVAEEHVPEVGKSDPVFEESESIAEKVEICSAEEKDEALKKVQDWTVEKDGQTFQNFNPDRELEMYDSNNVQLNCQQQMELKKSLREYNAQKEIEFSQYGEDWANFIPEDDRESGIRQVLRSQSDKIATHLETSRQSGIPLKFVKQELLEFQTQWNTMIDACSWPQKVKMFII